MNVTLVLPDFRTSVAGYSGAFAHGIAYLSRYLRNAGHSVSLLHMTSVPSKADFQAGVAATSPDLVGFSVIYHFFPIARQWAEWAKEITSVPIIFGGTYPTLDPETVISDPSVDMLCRGEGEQAFPELCDALEKGVGPGSVRNIWWKQDRKTIRNEIRPLVANLDSLDFPDYSVHDYDGLFFTKTDTLSVQFSRGCPFRCHYCSSRALADVYSAAGRYHRFMSPQRAVELLVYLKTSYPRTECFVFNDSILFPKKSWLETFSHLYGSQVGLPFVGNCRPELLDRDVAHTLHEMGCRLVCLGIESGNETINQQVLGRRLTQEQIRRAFDVAHEAGLRTVAYSILGCPFETRATLLETVKLVAALKSEIATSYIFYPFPGTRAYEMCRDSGFLTNRHFLNNDDGVMIKQPQLSDTEVLFFHGWYKRLVRAYDFIYALPQPARGILVRAADTMLLSRHLPCKVLIAVKILLRTLRWRILLMKRIHAPARF
jgi:radical SAM superfamily enzyme YgiQ (UPF0313 family)